MSKKLTTEEFIEKAKLIHGDKYDYSKVEYRGNKVKAVIICPIHGEWELRPNDHLSGYGCPKCAGNVKYTTEEWVNLAKKKFPNIDYSKVNYLGAAIPVTLVCPKHGEFKLDPNNFINNIKGCPKCGKELLCSKLSFTKELFIEKSNKVHNNKYDYSKVNYINSLEDVCIICPIHGEFWLLANSHILGSECPLCNKEHLSNLFLKTTELFIKEAKQIHGNKYDYSKVNYTGKDNKIEIICSKHGSFYLSPHAHLSGQGCPKCNQSKGELMIEKYLKERNIEYISQKVCHLNLVVKKTNKIILDFLVTYKNRKYIIEYHGEQHYNYIPYFHESENEFKLQQRRDNILRKLCLNNGIPLIEIPYTIKDKQSLYNILDNYFDNSPIIYTDGSYSNSTDSGGWGFIEVINNKPVYYKSNKVIGTTNNRMELTSVLYALAYCLKKHITKCAIVSDSMYVVGCASKGWKRTKNTDLWAIFDKLWNKLCILGYDIKFKHVKGHQIDDSNDTKWNNEVDKLVVKASQSI